jgi:hypothetical protein
MRRFGVSRIILPDPDRTDRKENWLAVARHAATMGFEVRFEIDPATIDHHSTDDAESKELPKILPIASAATFKKKVLDRVGELAEMKNASEAKVASGFFVALSPPAALPSGWEAGLSEATFADFLRDTGLESVWGGDLKNEESRKEFVKSRGLMPWLTWRSRRIATFYGELARAISQTHGLALTIAAPQPGNIEAHALYEEAERIGSSPIFAWRWMAFEPELWRNESSIRLIGSESVSPQGEPNRDWATHPDLEAALGPQSTQGHWFAGRRFASFTEPSSGWDDREFDPLMAAMVSYLSRHDSSALIVDRSTLGDRHKEFAAWVSRYEGLPELGRKAWETVAPKPGLTLRGYSSGASELLVPINPLPCTIRLELSLVSREGSTAEPMDPDSSLKLSMERTGPDRATARLTIPPMHLGRLDLGRFRIESYRAELPQESQDVIRTRYDALIRQNDEALTHGPAAVAGTLTDAESKTRGRRFMAALQAYRDMRLADFFRLSDGISADRRSRRMIENPGEVGRVDLPNRRIIR